MDENVAAKLNAYNSAYNAVCQWSEEPKPAKKDVSDKTFTLDVAEEWASKLQNEDGSSGPHWTMEQAKRIMAQRNLSLDPTEFWIAINLIYSDFSPVAKKHGVGGNLDFYVDMAKAFLNDKDAGPNKIARYYECVVK
nr:MAG: hypothetical protein [Bacteriophage sp.]